MAQKNEVRVKLLSSRCGHVYDQHGRFTGAFSQAVGDVVSMDADEAQRYISAGLATPANDSK